MSTPEFQPQFEKSNEGSSHEFPLLEGKTPEQLHSIARALGRTTSTGRRTPTGSPISVESEAVAQMMARNELKEQGGEQNG
jgi:hypothetical protein